MTKKIAALQKGDLIHIVAPSSPFDKTAFLAGVNILQKWGFRVFYEESIFSKQPFLAGTDTVRAKQLKKALTNKKAKAILFARGGYGSARVLKTLGEINFKTTTPKLVLGYSDITSLLIPLAQKHNWPCFYGPVVAKDLAPNTKAFTSQSLQQALTSPKALGKIQHKNLIFLKKGQAEAKISGGCLTLINTSLKTPWEIKTKDRILFIEDTGEKPYAIDRLLTQLKLAGKLNQIKGVVVGSLLGPNPDTHYQDVILDQFKEFDFPIAYGFPAGHGVDKLSFPLEAKIKMNSKNKSITFLETHLK